MEAVHFDRLDRQFLWDFRGISVAFRGECPVKHGPGGASDPKGLGTAVGVASVRSDRLGRGHPPDRIVPMTSTCLTLLNVILPHTPERGT